MQCPNCESSNFRFTYFSYDKKNYACLNCNCFSYSLDSNDNILRTKITTNKYSVEVLYDSCESIIYNKYNQLLIRLDSIIDLNNFNNYSEKLFNNKIDKYIVFM